MIEVLLLQNNSVIEIHSQVINTNVYDYINVVEHDPYGVLDANGTSVSVPYFDPPPGGYVGHTADNLPFYWDSDGCLSCLEAFKKSKWVDTNKIVFHDSPRDYRLQDGEYVQFSTSLVKLNEDLSWVVVETVKWKLTNNGIVLDN